MLRKIDRKPNNHREKRRRNGGLTMLELVLVLTVLAVLAGLCEEILFRGLVFQFLRPVHQGMAILVCNLLFGLAHLITPLYAVLAALAGLYLTGLMVLAPDSNLLVPITAHAVYDFFAFLIVVRDFRLHRKQR